jgi:hypothetical protein
MKHKLAATIAAVAVLGAVGAGGAVAAGYGPGNAGWGDRADCPYATDGTPLRIHAQDGTGAGTGAGARQRLRDGTGAGAGAGAQQRLRDGTGAGPHGTWQNGS